MCCVDKVKGSFSKWKQMKKKPAINLDTIFYVIKCKKLHYPLNESQVFVEDKKGQRMAVR